MQGERKCQHDVAETLKNVAILYYTGLCLPGGGSLIMVSKRRALKRQSSSIYISYVDFCSCQLTQH